MKKSLLILSLGVVCGATAFAQTTQTFSCAADTWVRESVPGEKHYDKATVEVGKDNIKDEATDEVTGFNRRAALFAFNFSIPAGQKVQSAKIHLVTERYKGGEVSVYEYGDFSEGDVTWSTEGEAVTAALQTTPILTFRPAGQNQKAMFDGGINEEYQSLAAWTNSLDVTNYVKSAPATAQYIDLMLYTEGEARFYTKENTGQDNAFKETAAQTNIPAADLMPYLEVVFVEDADNSTDVLGASADTWVRSNKVDTNNSTSTELEIYHYQPMKDDAPDGDYVTFVGLMSFNLPSELLSDNYELQGASLRLVSTQIKGNREIGLYSFGTFSETANWNDVSAQVSAALATEPFETFEAKGQGNKNIVKDELSEEYYEASAWTNIIDFSSYVAEAIEAGNSTVSFMLSKIEAGNNAIKFATKDWTDAENAKNSSLSYPASVMVPQLTVSYNKVGNDEPDDPNSGVETIVIESNAPVYFDLQGRQIANPEKGIYVVRQGNKVSKVIR